MLVPEERLRPEPPGRTHPLCRSDAERGTIGVRGAVTNAGGAAAETAHASKGAGRGSLFLGAPIFPTILVKSRCTNGLAIERTQLICPSDLLFPTKTLGFFRAETRKSDRPLAILFAHRAFCARLIRLRQIGSSKSALNPLT